VAIGSAEQATIAKADALFTKDPAPYEEEYQVLSQGQKDFPNDPEIAWRLCRSYYHMATEVHSADAVEKKKWLEDGLEVAKKTKEKFPEHFGGYKWSALLLGTLGDLLATKEKIANSFTIKDNLLQAEKLAPKDATTKVALAKWCYAVASIGFLERNLASVLFATPPTSSFEEALGYLKAAREVIDSDKVLWKATQPQALLMTGMSYEGLGNKEEAKKWFQQVLTLEGQSKSLAADKKVAQERITALSSSWW